MNLFATEFDAVDNSVTLQLKPGRMAYLLCIEGAVTVSAEDSAQSCDAGASSPVAGGKGRNPVTARRHDAVELQGQGSGDAAAAAVAVSVKAAAVEAAEGAVKVAHFIVFEMPQDPRGGRKDLS